ncbi:Protein SAWADEE HOMEODOMAIN HOMOLOG 2 [Linum perenne]
MMARLGKRQKLVFSGFTKAETEKMDRLLDDSVQPLNTELFKKLARGFNQSSGRAGKPAVRWTEVESWFQSRQQGLVPQLCSATDTSKDGSTSPRAGPANEPQDTIQKATGNIRDLSNMDFEARSSKDGAWYDVDMFLCHRYLPSGEAEVHVRFEGFGAEENEWVNVRHGVRQRSIPFDHSECHKVKEGDLERKDHAMYYDAHVTEIQRKTHDIRGCRCIFKILYDHDNIEVRVVPS